MSGPGPAQCRWAHRLLAALVLVTALWTATGVASAAPSDTPAAPSSSAPAEPGQSTGADPSTAEDPASSGGDEIKWGTPKEGQLHWDQFGGNADEGPQTLDEFSTFVIGLLLTGTGVVAVITSLTICLLMAVGVRGRSEVAKRALESSIWVWAGVVLAGSFSSIGGALLLSSGIG